MGWSWACIEAMPAELVDNLLLLENEIDIKTEEDDKKMKRKNGRT